ncbi:lactate 2-monooxygenase [Saccharopolyspora erythraea NRRL 2338]|uniref:Lactate 2-monooxygenase n=1 Tax=Saccharopolyspora erythraea (strain ATCC 11635 / DSM 40517 / JCM 4748 / NBRC 13426 / NCIMB 8594 / NRRL 2338) TaxID=405948 RepID=A4FNR7_SACEN|nr:lactate 2-monooxygenase [Saccharopolyspora erythraea D]CAM05692.1 lactate 2-monooxygenase [Saccharopolyspora erythraea NRRL 2338]
MTGDRSEDPVTAGESFGRAVQAQIYRAGLFGRTPRVPVSPDALEAAARRRMSRTAWAYVAGSAGRERTAHANRSALDRWEIVPRMLRDVEDRDTGVELFGARLPSPFLFAPVGVLEMAHQEADLAVAAAARELGVPMVISTQGSVPMEETAVALAETVRWYQLYWPGDDGLAASLVRRAEATGAAAIVVTLDTDLLGWRTRDLDLAWLPFGRAMGIAQYLSDPVFAELVAERASRPRQDAPVKPGLAALKTLAGIARRYPGGFLRNLTSPLPRAAVETFLDVFSRPALTWEHLAWLRERTSLPIVLKGLQHPDDAALALDHGVDGIIVSNHGGRQVDGAIGAIDALPGIAERVGGRIPVLFDSGIRSGADAFKALALGARAVLVGRPYVYGLALAGADGAREVVRNLMAEFDLTMALTGRTTTSDITRDALR